LNLNSGSVAITQTAATSAPAKATGTFTITGTPTTTDTNSYVIGGFTVTTPQTTGNTVTQQAAADIALINANASIAALGVATNVAGVITFTAKVGASGNNITTTSSSTAGDTVTANQATLSGGGGYGTISYPTAPVNSPNDSGWWVGHIGMSKIKAMLIGSGSGYEVSLYGTDDPTVYNPGYNKQLEAQYLLGSNDPNTYPSPTSSVLIPGPSEQSGAGTIANPLTTAVPIMFTQMQWAGIRAVLTTTSNPTGSVAVVLFAIP
jgi:hypothetical protein